MVMSDVNQISEILVPDILKLDVRLKNILAGMGMKEENADSYLIDLINEFTIRCKNICEPKAGFSVYHNPQFCHEEKILIIDNISLDIGKQVYVSLKKSEGIAVFICTIGNKTELLSKQLMRDGHGLEGLIVDLIGSELAEETAEFVHNTVAVKSEKTGLRITNRYSPGYCNWHVKNQHKLFRLMKDTCGVKLTESSLMVPVKSVSGIIGIGKEVKKVAYKCKLCNDTECILRNRD